ncbi:MAG: four helix bundle protein [bacterium]|nr:four helix bundle protein [bacterium]
MAEDNTSYKRLIAWEKADVFAKEVYKITAKFPKTEIYGLTSQLRRAVLSVPLNIIEGYARNNKKEFRNFLRIAYASLVEVEYLLEFALVQRYLADKEFAYLDSLRQECGRVLWKLLKSQQDL